MNSGPVRLKSASLALGGGAGQVHSRFDVQVKVKNVAFVKDVRLHYGGRSGAWQDRPLAWKGSSSTYDLFALDPALDLQADPFVEFAISFTANGGTAWDNNDFANYTLSPAAPRLAGGNVVLEAAGLVYGGTAGSSYVTGISGQILVNSLSYHKRVVARYSDDGWLSYLDLDAAYPESLGGTLERWRFGRNTAPSAFARGEFAIYHQNLETGQYFWDNNFGQNYSLKDRDRLE